MGLKKRCQDLVPLETDVQYCYFEFVLSTP